MDKTQDVITMIGYGPLLGGLLLAVAFLAGSLYTQQGRLRRAKPKGPLKEAKGPLREAQLTESNGLKGEPSTTDIEDQDLAPAIRYINVSPGPSKRVLLPGDAGERWRKI